MRLFKCSDEFAKLSLVTSADVPMQNHSMTISKLFIEYADIFARVGVYGFTFVRLNANSHNGIQGRELIASFSSPMTNLVSDFIANKILYLVLTGNNLMTRKMLDVYIRIENGNKKSPISYFPMLRNFISKIIMEGIASDTAIESTMSDSRVRYNFPLPFVKHDDPSNHIKARKKRAGGAQTADQEPGERDGDVEVFFNRGADTSGRRRI